MPAIKMLKDNLPSYNPPNTDDLDVSPNHEIFVILDFIDRNISSFCPYYQTIKDSHRENRISYFLSCYFNICLNEDRTAGFLPLNFVKNPSQELSTKETDIGVVVLTKTIKPDPIIEFEAKRFSETSNNKEYVNGERGGIERFKRGYHSSSLSICGMFGYVQSRTSLEWIAKVNDWIDGETQNNIGNDDIDWKSRDEKLSTVTYFQDVVKLKSEHTRKQLNNTILLWHYFIYLA